MKINPFRPNSPIPSGLFVGRIKEIDVLEKSLVQTRAGQPTNFMVTGERGIGKTSILDYIRYVAQGEIDSDHTTDNLRFLVISADIEATTTQISLIRRIERAFARELAKTEKAWTLFNELWKFVKNLESAAGVKVQSKKVEETEVILDEFAYSIAQTTNRLCNPETSLEKFGSSYDGVLLMLDECDKSSPDLSLGSILKLLLERIQRHGCDHYRHRRAR